MDDWLGERFLQEVERYWPFQCFSLYSEVALRTVLIPDEFARSTHQDEIFFRFT